MIYKSSHILNETTKQMEHIIDLIEDKIYITKSELKEAELLSKKLTEETGFTHSFKVVRHYPDYDKFIEP